MFVTTSETVSCRKRISDTLDNHPEGLTVEQICENTGIPESTVRSILNNRRAWGEVEVIYRHPQKGDA